ncbi:glycosyltransferase family 2 protein [Leptolyngbya cf. ectocarpi LEGE 11479]|uniref:Glycosyltransferase family 2 protein n=1 Tax=Leptolyngbya cf. ectocarpi LEGE 11479 TaxID=1828722 RepID=A0A928ZVS5_LEPEC|nr:glycosyltransferase [Leptolyngbya ectocarpi]MBE9068389.1 glycosyltransferase family 2 protein [Leptolyngbya cf. ectocarpi LEGE 11479]
MTSTIVTASTATPDSTSQPSLTIVVVPRERFSYSQQSLESIYQHTQMPFELVYVDGGSPMAVRNYLHQAALERGFTLVRTEQFLAPNQARNFGLSQVSTDYVLFIDNDVYASNGWLENLWQCAQVTDAAVVCPLTCIGKPLHQKIHLAGGEARIFTELKRDNVRRRVHEKHYFVNRAVADVQDQLQRRACEFAEFHCMLVKRSVFEEIGPLDEKLLSTREHIDFCLQINQSSGQIYCEPSSVVSYVPDILYRWSDLAFFMLRWSDDWEVKSLKHFRQKWNLDKDKYFKKRYQRLGHRRHYAFLRPLVRTLAWGRTIPWLEKLAIRLERQLNRIITERYESLYGDRLQTRPQEIMSKPSG